MGSSSTEQYCLRWNDFHSNVTNAFSDIRDEEDFLDVTLVTPSFTVLSTVLKTNLCSGACKDRLSDTKQPFLYCAGRLLVG
jgi:hypothetical protein